MNLSEFAEFGSCYVAVAGIIGLRHQSEHCVLLRKRYTSEAMTCKGLLQVKFKIAFAYGGGNLPHVFFRPSTSGPIS